MIAETSLDAYDRVKETSLSPQCARIMDFMRLIKQPRTRRQISAALQMEYSTACARVNDLVRDKKLTEDGTRQKNFDTGASGKLVSLPTVGQVSLF
jgi:hypothetical protein